MREYVESQPTTSRKTVGEKEGALVGNLACDAGALRLEETDRAGEDVGLLGVGHVGHLESCVGEIPHQPPCLEEQR